MAEAPTLARGASMGTMMAPADPSKPPGRVRHMFKKLDKDNSGILSKEELIKGFEHEFQGLSDRVKAGLEQAYEEHASGEEDNRGLSIKVFGRFYCEMLFLHFDVRPAPTPLLAPAQPTLPPISASQADNSRTLELNEFQNALAHLIKPNADGTRTIPTIPYPPEYQGDNGQVHLPFKWFLRFFYSMD